MGVIASPIPDNLIVCLIFFQTNTAPYYENPPVISGLPSLMASDAEIIFIPWRYNDYLSINLHCVFIIPCNCWPLPLQTKGPYKHHNYPPTPENYFFQWPCRAPYHNVTSGRPCKITSAIWTNIGRVFPFNKFHRFPYYTMHCKHNFAAPISNKGRSLNNWFIGCTMCFEKRIKRPNYIT